MSFPKTDNIWNELDGQRRSENDDARRWESCQEMHTKCFQISTNKIKILVQLEYTDVNVTDHMDVFSVTPSQMV